MGQRLVITTESESHLNPSIATVKLAGGQFRPPVSNAPRHTMNQLSLVFADRKNISLVAYTPFSEIYVATGTNGSFF
jgi:hypothetical protein